MTVVREIGQLQGDELHFPPTPINFGCIALVIKALQALYEKGGALLGWLLGMRVHVREDREHFVRQLLSIYIVYKISTDIMHSILLILPHPFLEHRP